MFTQCPDCLSVYKTNLAILKSGHGQLRCGHCGSVFDALPSLVEQLPDGFDLSSRLPLARVEADVAPPVLAMPLITPIDADFEFKLDADLVQAPRVPQSASEERARIEPHLAEAPAWQTLDSFATDARNPPAASALDDRSQRHTAPADRGTPMRERAIYRLDQERAQNKREPSSSAPRQPAQAQAASVPMVATRVASTAPTRAPRWPWILLSILLVTLLAAQIAWYERSTLLNNPSLRPWLQRLCQIAGCTLPLPFTPSAIAVLDRDVKPHPSAKGALMISASIRNTASYTQSYPLVEVRLTDLGGQLVALRRFAPADYLQDAQAQALGFAAGASLPLVFEVQDPGRDAVNFEFEFVSEFVARSLPAR
jgi:predicted Zn finger-like uncharacterized protein